MRSPLADTIGPVGFTCASCASRLNLRSSSALVCRSTFADLAFDAILLLQIELHLLGQPAHVARLEGGELRFGARDALGSASRLLP
jgi:hypothetical protein